MVDPLTSSGAIQVGFFNQSKNLNRQVPLFELAEESKQGLELPPGQQATLKARVRVGDAGRQTRTGTRHDGDTTATTAPERRKQAGAGKTSEPSSAQATRVYGSSAVGHCR